MDFIVRKIIDVALYFVALCKKKPEDGENFKPPYDVADSAPDALIFVVQIYFLIPFFPYITVIAPILLYLDFKFELVKLRFLKSKALKSSLRDVIKKDNNRKQLILLCHSLTRQCILF